MIKVLENPITPNYLQFKDIVLSPTFPWLYTLSTKMPFYSHTFLERPEKGKFSNPQSELLGLNLKVLRALVISPNKELVFDGRNSFLSIRTCLLYFKPNFLNKSLSFLFLRLSLFLSKNSTNSNINQTADLNFDYLYWLENFGLVMLWIAAILTLITGFEYFKKAIPVLREGK